MLTENDVVYAVVQHLRGDGWCVQGTSNTNERGHDVLASKDGTAFAIEAKGATSSKAGTKRYGKEFTRSQMRNHVSRALFKAASVFNAGKCRAGIALPATKTHLEFIKEIDSALDVLDVTVLFVENNGSVFQHSK